MIYNIKCDIITKHKRVCMNVLPKFLVGIGASAGGLEALEEFFRSVTPLPDVSFVIIQHLSPRHKSLMPELLRRYTKIPIETITDKQSLKANKIYLMPAGASVMLENNLFKLTPRDDHEFILPIDIFFASLAESYQRSAIAVILSGTGSDGSRGVTAVNTSGGVVFAQSPESAKFDGMPMSAINSGVVDVSGTPTHLATRLYDYLIKLPIAINTYENESQGEDTDTDMISNILMMLERKTGIPFQQYKSATILRRIERRMQIQHLSDLADYYKLLISSGSEIDLLKREILIPVTSFFRDQAVFERLESDIIPTILDNIGDKESIRVWSAGCSTGEEAYSIAMLFFEAFERRQKWYRLKIFATDVNEHNLAIAGTGAYPESIIREVSPERLQRFFNKYGGQYYIDRNIRASVVFAKHDLLKDPAFTRMHMVLCRNALIYFKQKAQDLALSRLTYAAKGGYLVLGSSESIGNVSVRYDSIDSKLKIFKCHQSNGYEGLLSSDVLSVGHYDGQDYRRSSPSNKSLLNLANQQLLDDYARPSLLISAKGEILHVFGKAQRYLQMPSGPVQMLVSKTLLPELSAMAQALVFKCHRDDIAISSSEVLLDIDKLVYVTMKVRPLKCEGFTYLLVSFEERDYQDQQENHHSNQAYQNKDKTTNFDRVAILQQELDATRESLQATIEELETSNEELQATNEELMASNEELQSSNEELQSVNEELSTVNAEYHEKVHLLNNLNADLECMSKAVGIATVFLDKHLHITRFTPEIMTIFKLRDSDVGRPLTEMKTMLTSDQLDYDLKQAQSKNQMIERKVMTIDGRDLIMRIIPYPIEDSVHIGLVISFIDVTHVQELHRLQAIIDSLKAHIVVLDINGNISMLNKSWLRFAKANGDPKMNKSGIGSNYFEACLAEIKGVADASAKIAHDGIKAVIEGTKPSFSYIYPCHSLTVKRWFLMEVSAVHGLDDMVVVVAHTNISDIYQDGVDSDR